MATIDPQEFGRMQAEIEQLQTDLTEVKRDVKSMLELANRSKGAFWASMSIASGVGAVASFIIERVFLK